MRPADGEERAPATGGHILAVDDARHQQHEADDRHFEHAPGTDEAQVDPHEHGDGNCHEHRERPPRARRQRLDDDQREHREDDDHDHQNAEKRDQPGHLAELRFDHVAQRAAVAAHGDEQDHEVLHRAGEDDARKDPQRAGEIAHLRRQHRAHQRAGAGDRREMVTEEDVLVGRHVIEAVVVLDGRRHPRRIEPEHAAGDIEAVVTVGDQVYARRGDDQPHGVDRLAAMQRDRSECKSADHGDGQPTQHGSCSVHTVLPRPTPRPRRGSDAPSGLAACHRAPIGRSDRSPRPRR